MNPDPNQPQAPAETPAPEVPATPVVDTTQAPVFESAPVQETPLAPVEPAPAVTLGSTPVSSATPGFKLPQNKKKLLTMIAIIVGALIVLGIAAAVVIGMLFPSRADYKSASSQFYNVSSAYSDLNSDAVKLQYDVSGSTTDTEYTNDSDSVAKSITAYKDANTKLSTMKAVKVGDGQKLYSAYEAKANSLITYATDLSASLKSFRPVAVACDDVSTVTLLTECSTALDNVGTIPNADLKQFVTTLQTQYKAYLSIKTKVAAITDPYGAQYDTYKGLRDQGYDIQDKISSAATDFSSNANKHAKDIDPSSAANALSDFLVKKAS